MMRSKPKAATPSERVARAQARQDAEGWRRLNLRLPPAAARDLTALLAAGYGDTPTAVIARALKAAAPPAPADID